MKIIHLNIAYMHRNNIAMESCESVRLRGWKG